MRKTFIISDRGFNHWPSLDLVYEWEDEMVKTVPTAQIYKKKELVVCGKRLLSYIERLIGWGIDNCLIGNNNGFHFDMVTSTGGHNPFNRRGYSHCIVDFYLRKEQLDGFYRSYDKVAHLYVSSREVFDFLQANNPPRQVEYMPLSLPDKYRITKDSVFSKEYDFVLVGRQSPVLMEFLKEYEKTHDISYVTRGKLANGHFPYYTREGEFVGNVDTRDDYFRLLRKSRIAFYSTAGMDGDKATNGFHQVTPRLLEELASGCHVLSRYEKNSDTDYYELDRITRRIESYEDFEKAIDKALNTPVDMAAYSEYLQEHYTSTILQRYYKG